MRFFGFPMMGLSLVLLGEKCQKKKKKMMEPYKLGFSFLLAIMLTGGCNIRKRVRLN